MNTGIQTSTATPYGAMTTTNPAANIKNIWPKDLMGIVAAHNIPYAATASVTGEIVLDEGIDARSLCRIKSVWHIGHHFTDF